MNTTVTPGKLSREVLQVLDVIAVEKNINKEALFLGLERALAFATKRNFDNEFPEIEVTIDRVTGKYRTFRKWAIVTDVDFYDDDKELSVSDVTEKYGAELANVGEFITEELENIDFGRVSAQTARGIISQSIKDAERQQVIDDYLSRNSGIVMGKIRKIERGNIIIDCGKIEAIIMKQSAIEKEVFRVGEQVKGFIDKNNVQIKNGRLLISRACNEFLLKLIENNSPEVASGKVAIRGVAREAGVRSKIAVSTLDSRLDAKGAVIGFRNQRIDSVMHDLFDEKIDVIEYSDDKVEYVMNALAPAEIDSIVFDEEKNLFDVIVEDDKLGSAIGSDGVNVRLASRLVGSTINLFGKSEAKDKREQEYKALVQMFNDALTVEDDVSELLVDNGFTTLEEVAYVDISDLLEIEDFDEDVAGELQERARATLEEKNTKYKAKMEKLSTSLSQIVKLSPDVLLKLVESNILDLEDFADLSGGELMDLISIDEETANKLVLKAREVCGYFA